MRLWAPGARSVAADDVLDIETNPNRPDTLSIIGIAREVAAVTEQQLTLPTLQRFATEPEWTGLDSIQVDVESPDLCPRYSALRIGGLSPASSPFSMQTRLQAAGMRPINLIVDITNYVMLEYGQPMHAFDASRIAGNRINVRRASPQERIHTLDGAERTLGPDNLVIADGERTIAVAGVMGGENSEVDGTTTEMVLESATFDPVSVRRTAKQLVLRTEASARFEKGLPPEQTALGLERYLQLLADVSPGPLRVGKVSDVWVGPEPERRVSMPMRDLHRLTGVEIRVDAAEEALSLLGFDVDVRDDVVTATVPFWRRADVSMSADLVEEVARMVGFDQIPPTLPLHTMPPAEALPALKWESVLREELLAIGLAECVTHSLTSPESMTRMRGSSKQPEPGEEAWGDIIANPLGAYAREAGALPVAVANPATRDRRVMPDAPAEFARRDGPQLQKRR